MKSNDLSFSQDVAETIGVEAAIILKFIEDNKITSNSLEDISEIISERFSFMEQKKIISSIYKHNKSIVEEAWGLRGVRGNQVLAITITQNKAQHNK